MRVSNFLEPDPNFFYFGKTGEKPYDDFLECLIQSAKPRLAHKIAFKTLKCELDLNPCQTPC